MQFSNVLFFIRLLLRLMILVYFFLSEKRPNCLMRFSIEKGALHVCSIDWLIDQHWLFRSMEKNQTGSVVHSLFSHSSKEKTEATTVQLWYLSTHCKFQLEFHTHWPNFSAAKRNNPNQRHHTFFPTNTISPFPRFKLKPYHARVLNRSPEYKSPKLSGPWWAGVWCNTININM